MAGFAETVSSALGVNPTQAPAGYTGRVPDSEPRAILAEELRKSPDNPDIRREIELRFPDMLKGETASSAVAPEGGGFSAASVINALNAPAPKPPPPGLFENTLERGAAIPQAAANVVTGIGSSILGGWRGVTTVATGGSLEDAAQAVHQTGSESTYRPPDGTAGAAAVGALESKWNPLNWPGMAAHKAGEVVADTTGSPAAGAAVETAGNAVLPGVLLKGAGKAMGAVRRGAPRVVDAEVIPPKETPLSQIGRAENLDIPTVIRRGGKVAVETPGRAALSLVPKAGEPAATAPPEAPKPVLTLTPNESTPGRTGNAKFDETPPEAAARVAEESAPEFSEKEPAAPVGTELGAEEQARRSSVLARVGIAPEEQRLSAVTGDGTAASTDFQQSKVDNVAGRFIKTKLEAERQALASHADQIVSDTGGTLGVDGQTLEARGHTILQPLDSLKGWFEKNTRKLYVEADKRAGGVPTEMPATHALIGGDTADFLGTTEGEALLRGVKTRMKSLGMVDESGAPKAATVEQAERLKQYLNDQWQPRTAKLVRNMKDAIDDDVMKTAGEDVYKQARAMRAMRAATLDNPNGIAKILDASGPDGVNRAVPVERVADAITAMPNAQFAHIVETLKNVPPELRGQAQAALAEIKAQFANRIHEAGAGGPQGGQWRARDVSAYLNKNSPKLSQIFSADELAKIGDLNDAGHILAQDRSYPGAAVQANNLMQRGAMTALPKVGAGIGATLGALVGAPGTGALVGESVGAGAAARIGEKAALRSAQKRWGVKLSDFPK